MGHNEEHTAVVSKTKIKPFYWLVGNCPVNCVFAGAITHKMRLYNDAYIIWFSFSGHPCKCVGAYSPTPSQPTIPYICAIYI